MKIKINTKTGYIENTLESYEQCMTYINQLKEDGIEITTYEIILSNKYKSDDTLNDDSYKKLIEMGISNYDGTLDAFMSLLGEEKKTETYH